MVDYSKWDKFEVDDDSDGDLPSNAAQVRQIGGKQGGGKIEIGPSGYSIHDETGEEIEKYEERRIDNVSQGKVTSTPNNRRITSLEINTENGSCGVYRGAHYYWSQDRYEVSLTIFLDWLEGMKKKDIAVSYFSGTKEVKISSRSSSNVQQFKGNFQFGVELTGDPENPWDDVFEWDICTDLVHPVDTSHLFTGIKFVLKKVSPLPNATFWWKNVFVGEPHIDVTKISGRNTSSAVTQDEFQQAQQLFLERLRRQREEGTDSRIPIDEDIN